MDQQLTVDGHSLSLTQTPDGHLLRVTGPDGGAGLTIILTPQGPVLRVASGLRVEVAGDLNLEAENVRIHGRDDVRIEAGRGDVFIRANDDVRLDGERIRNNC